MWIVYVRRSTKDLFAIRCAFLIHTLNCHRFTCATPQHSIYTGIQVLAVLYIVRGLLLLTHRDFARIKQLPSSSRCQNLFDAQSAAKNLGKRRGSKHRPTRSSGDVENPNKRNSDKRRQNDESSGDSVPVRPASSGTTTNSLYRAEVTKSLTRACSRQNSPRDHK